MNCLVTSVVPHTWQTRSRSARCGRCTRRLGARRREAWLRGGESAGGGQGTFVDGARTEAKPDFLEDMSRKVYSGDMGLEDRVQRQRHRGDKRTKKGKRKA